jgi:hypothetical protein
VTAAGTLIAAAAALLFALPVGAAFHPDVPRVLTALSALILVATAARPVWGLQLTCAMLPLSMPLFVLSAAPFTGEETLELVAAPFACAAAARAVFVRDVPARLFWPAATLGALVAGAAVVQLAQLQQATAFGDEFLTGIARYLARTYFSDARPYPPVHTAMFWLEGLAVAVAAERILRRAPEARAGVLRMAILGAAAAAAIAAYRLVEISIRTDAPSAAALDFLRTLRFNPHFADLNAGGSYYVLFFVPAAWWAWERRRVGGIAAAGLIGLALWTTGSRTALAAAVIGLGLAWAWRRRVSGRVLLAGTLVAVIGAGLVMLNPGRDQATAGDAVEIRARLIPIAFELAWRAPVFGLGLNQFKPASAGVVTEGLVGRFLANAGGENAHNNYLQVLVELGAAGLISFLWLVAVVALPFARAARNGRAGPDSVGLAAGLAAFLLTCLAGHPLLVPQVLLPFCLAAGLMAGILDAPVPAGRAPRSSWIGAAAVLLVAAAVPPRAIAGRADAPLPGVQIGLAAARNEQDGVVYHWTGRRARWFISGSSRAVELPLRLAADSTVPCQVDVAIDGHHAGTVDVAREGWQRLTLSLDALEARRTRRIDARVAPPACLVVAGVISER